MVARGPLLYERIIEYVLDEIRRGALVPGDRVSSEMELAEQFEVSRITSKRALELLRQAGVVERIRGKGSFVADELPDLDQLAIPAPGAAAERAAQGERAPGAIAMIYPDASEAYGLELLAAVEERCAEHGIALVIKRTRGDQAEEERAIASMVDGGLVDGLIVFPVHGEYYNARLLRTILAGYPLVLVDRYLAGIQACAVHTDNVAAGRTLTDRLLDLGHRHIAFVSPPPENTSSIEERLEGFRTALAGRGLPLGHQHLLTGLSSTLPGAFSAENVRADVERVRAFQKREPEVTAFVVCEYNLARVMDRAVEAPPGRDRPLIACFDSAGDPVAGPAFLHVRQDQREMGRRAVDLLLAQTRGEPVPSRSIVPFTIVEAHDQHEPR
ncbi:GntR family transcriptional regulator [Nonomuraea deserti]|uniref:GntR family transcriptional regulator n=1 Tax=Nonomuraea deserti TaxID=1848322 RepID=A0A4R4VK31_9ACTN|nr:substrate-binding domain-containing protein [Nonomuraea deserti]TDD02485.1 GntR family transcriptional regulator [Nonomuraea deserti]